MATSSPPELDAQYRLLREEVGVVSGIERRFLGVTGEEAAEYLQGQLTNDVESLAPGEGCYAALLDRKGKMRADMRVLRVAPDELLLDAEPAGADALASHLGMYRIGRDVEIEEPALELVRIIGPATERLLGEPQGPADSHRELQLAGVGVRLVAHPQGADLIVPHGRGDELAAALVDRGAEPVEEAAAELLRIEAGVPRFGIDMDTSTIPQEAGINERAVSFTKGCYIGQETVARLHYKGRPNRHLRGLASATPLTTGASVAGPERQVGTVGSAALSPAHGPVALAILRREAEPGTKVEVEPGIEATVVELPFERGEG